MAGHSGETYRSHATAPGRPATRRETLRHLVGRDAAGAGPVAAPKLTNGQIQELVGKLVKRMKLGADFQWDLAGAWSSYDNEGLPSGYTYFAQLVAHDMVSNNNQLSMIGAYPAELRRDYRVRRLVLDTIYGGGPDATPLPYAEGSAGVPHKCLFRLGHVRPREPQPYETTPPAPLVGQAARDIPRGRCPFLTDAPDPVATPDALVADARNDQHLIIAQLTALLHELHNIVFGKLRALQTWPSHLLSQELGLPKRRQYADDDVFSRAQDEAAFLHARKLVVYTYRSIVRQDLLKRLLEPGVYAFYADAAREYPNDLAFDPQGRQTPVEFSHAVYRFGHVMARISYSLNGDLRHTPGIDKLLLRSSAKSSRLLPLAKNWLVDWSRFFDLGDGAPLNLAQRISPYTNDHLLAQDGVAASRTGTDGGIYRLDFLRGYEAEVNSVDELIAALAAKRPREVARSALLADGDLRKHEIGRWLDYGPDVGFTSDERVLLTNNPPLLLFVLLEAALTQGGKRLGILGSTMLADVFFPALDADWDVIEGDAAVPRLAELTFGAAPPESMAALVKWMRANGGLGNPSTA